MERILLEVKDIIEKERLDVYLSRKIKNLSRSNIKALIKKNMVKVNQKIQKSNYTVKINDIIELFIEEAPEKIEIKPEKMFLDILYEDKYLAVINKPQGMVVHPGTGNGTKTLANGLLYNFKNLSDCNGEGRPGIVHRLDKDTSGLIVIAKDNNTHTLLAEDFKNHLITRIYIGIVERVIKEDKGIIKAPIGRHNKERKIMEVKEEGGKEAITHFKVLKRYKENTLIEAELETGRTHQIRVHFKFIGHPVVGDKTYGFKNQRFKLKGQLLHSKKLIFTHPITKKVIEVCSEPPDSFKEILETLERR